MVYNAINLCKFLGGAEEDDVNAKMAQVAQPLFRESVPAHWQKALTEVTYTRLSPKELV